MKFKVIEDAIRECKKHLNDSKTGSGEMENRLTAYLLVLICAQYEVRIEAMFEAYAARIRAC